MKHLAAVLALASLPSVSAAQAQCLSTQEAESIALVALPDILRATGVACTMLPPNSLVRRPTSAFLTKYDVAADAAWPAARAAIARISDPNIAVLLQSDYSRPLLSSMFSPQIVGNIQPSDCPTIERLVSLLEPLPAKNTAGIVIATLQYLKAEKARGHQPGVPDLPVCMLGKR